MSRELELKLEIDPAGVEKLRSLPQFGGAPRVERQISVYFDTPKGKLRRRGWVLRVRQHDEGWTQTIKRAGDGAGLFDRDEWESPVQGLQPDLAAIEATPLKDLVGPRQYAHLVPLFRSDVERATWLLETRGTAIEVSFDQGTISAGEQSEAIHELELELKQGDVGALFATARQIGRRVPLKLGVLAKSERGFILAEGERHAPTKAGLVPIDEEATVADGVAAIIAGCLRHFRINEPILIEGRDAEAMHQLRVAIRRLRTAMWLFRPAVKDDESAAINDELRRLTRELGAARNIDVILATMAAGDPARDHLERDRTRLYARIMRLIDTRRFRLFLLDLLAWAHDGAWRQGEKAGIRLARFARKRLDRLWKGMRKQGARLDALSEDERHELRINAKKMRYALEFLGGIGGAGQREFIAAAEGIQDSLGHLNDLATRRAMLAWPIEDSKKDVGRCLRAAKRHLRKMEQVGPFWRSGPAVLKVDR